MKVNIIIVCIIVASFNIAFVGCNVTGANKSEKSSKEEVIEIFKENEDYFLIIKDYSKLIDENIYVYKNNEIYFEYNDSDCLDDNKKEEAVEAINYLIEKLGCTGIFEDENGNIKFDFKGQYHGIYYVVQDKNSYITSGGGDYEIIKDNWYYYIEFPT